MGPQIGSPRFREVMKLVQAFTATREADEEDLGLSQPGPNGGELPAPSLVLLPRCMSLSFKKKKNLPSCGINNILFFQLNAQGQKE